MGNKEGLIMGMGRSLVIIMIVALKSAEGAERGESEALRVFIRSSCRSTMYPRVCYSSLVKHAESIQSSQVLLAGAALNVTLDSAKKITAAMSVMERRKRRRGLKPREVAAMKDCVELLADSVDELRRSIGEMVGLRTNNFEMTMSDVQTWVSAALTDDSTCSDGFPPSGLLQASFTPRILHLAYLTSNALAFINQLATSPHHS